jgi:hypothetical protein
MKLTAGAEIGKASADEAVICEHSGATMLP